MYALQRGAVSSTELISFAAEVFGGLFNRGGAGRSSTYTGFQSRAEPQTLLDDLRNLEEVVVTRRRIGAQRLRSGWVGDDSSR